MKSQEITIQEVREFYEADWEAIGIVPRRVKEDAQHPDPSTIWCLDGGDDERLLAAKASDRIQLTELADWIGEVDYYGHQPELRRNPDRWPTVVGLFRKWKKQRSHTTLVITVPKEAEEAFLAWVKENKWKVE